MIEIILAFFNAITFITFCLIIGFIAELGHKKALVLTFVIELIFVIIGVTYVFYMG